MTRIDALFDKLYADTFSMMRDTVSDMRRHMWPDQGTTSDTVEAQLETLQDTVSEQLANLMAKQGEAGEQVNDLRTRVDEIVSTTIRETREATTGPSRDEIAEQVLRFLRRQVGKTAAAREVWAYISALWPNTDAGQEFFGAVADLRTQGRIDYPDTLRPEDPMSLRPTISMPQDDNQPTEADE